jgi:TonB family protein
MKEIWKQWEGQVVNGRFPLQKYLGGSGHGIVFLTERDGPASQKAAIKLVVENPGQAEARLSVWAQTGSLSHPNLLQIFEAGRCRLGETALLYVVMEYADEDLSQILPQRALDPPEARELIPPVVNALAYLHGKGFVHGHLKPTNVMAIADQVKLSSDGLCAVAGSSGGWADYPGMDVYDPVYDPPETDGGTLTPAADIWSLGVTLVEALTLRRRIWDRTERGGAKKPELILPEGIPDPFLDIVRHCLIPDPRQRWTAAEIAARLEGRAIASPRPETARPRSRQDRSGQDTPAAHIPGLKNTSAKWLYPVIAVVGLALVILIGARMRRPPLPHLQVEQNQVEQTQTQNGAQQAAPAALEQPQVQPEPKPVPVTPMTTESAPSQSAQNQSAANQEAKAAGAPSPPTSPVPSSPSAAGAIPSAVLQQVLPEVSQRARSTIAGHVRVSVKVAVDASGNVISAALDSPGPSKYFARQALQAARGWKFTPAQMNGQQVPSEWILKFAFSSAGTDVRPTEVTP